MEQPNQITLTITMTDTGAISVHGPITNKIQCYAMLDLARDAIKDHNDKLTRSPIVPVSPGAALSLNGHRNGNPGSPGNHGTGR